MDQVYSFLLNYIRCHFDGLKFRGNDFCKEEMHALIKLAKIDKNYSLALRITAELIYAYPSEKNNPELQEGFILSIMSRTEQDIYANIMGNQVVSEGNFGKVKKSSTPTSEKRMVSPLPITPINNNPYKIGVTRPPESRSIHKISKKIEEGPTQPLTHHLRSQHLDQTSKTVKSISNRDHLDSSLNNSRAESRGSKRKIFSRGRQEDFDRRGMIE